MILRSRLGSATVLARAGERRLWLLDASHTVLWDLHHAGADDGLVALALAQQFHMTLEDAHRHLGQLRKNWRDAGLLEPDVSTPPIVDAPFEPLTTFPAPVLRSAQDGWWLTVAQQLVHTRIADDHLRGILEPLLASARCCEPLAPCDAHAGSNDADQLVLSGDVTQWQLDINAEPVDSGQGWEAAVVATLLALTELGCRTAERLIVVHGAGLITPDGRCVLMAARGGSGKSTLALALEAQGFGLFSDDVVPVRNDGAALRLGLPSTLKRGSWPVLVDLRPDVSQAVEVPRFGRTVRLIPPQSRSGADAVMPSLLIFPQYRVDCSATCTPLTPEQALQRLVESDAVIRDLSQQRLDSLCRWVEGIPAYGVTFPDLARGVSLVGRIVDDSSTG